MNPKLLHPSYQHRTFGMKTHMFFLVYIPYSNVNFTLSLILQMTVIIVWSRIPISIPKRFWEAFSRLAMVTQRSWVNDDLWICVRITSLTTLQ